MTDGLILTSSSITAAAIRDRVADAPAWARRAIDEAREQRGLPLLFGHRAAPAPAKRPRTGIVRCLIGVAAPGLSKPHILGGPGGHEPLPEFISPRAWAGVEKAVAGGARIAFQRGHDGKPFARSGDPAVAIEFDARLGLIFTLAPDAAAGFDWPAGGYCSIGFVEDSAKWTKMMLADGRWVRRIDSLTIRHVALLAPHDPPPAYRHARFVSCDPVAVHRSRASLLSVARGSIAEEAPLP